MTNDEEWKLVFEVVNVNNAKRLDIGSKKEQLTHFNDQQIKIFN
jgi:hypothetical protein